MRVSDAVIRLAAGMFVGLMASAAVVTVHTLLAWYAGRPLTSPDDLVIEWASLSAGLAMVWLLADRD